VSTQRYKLAKLATAYPDRCFTTLHQYLTVEWLEQAYGQTRKGGATGIDNQTAAEYEQHLESRLQDLLDRVKSGTYKAPPVKRAYIPKAGGKPRPIGIPTFEDKLLQRAIVMLLGSIYEQDFLDCSYGFRPKRSCHGALKALKTSLQQGGTYIIELDIQSFFDKLDKQQLRAMLQHRIGDGVIKRLINKWLKAGVLENGQVSYSETGTPQGGVISPLLANIYLHEVLDKWFENEVKPRLQGKGELIRFADDAVLVFSNARDCERVMEVLGKRFNRFGLQLHPDKTCQLKFTPREGQAFDFLGFTHYWGQTRNGRWTIRRKTAKSRQRRALKAIHQWCKRNRHVPIADQHKQLCRKISGHYSYFGISGNYRSLSSLRYWAEQLWLKWLKRRSQKAKFNWGRGALILDRYPLPKARILHPLV
jgi:group II intron reverse transcriptase/maturase